jgi:methylated-DNA-[protein]-cysteine S-methyltransferase
MSVTPFQQRVYDACSTIPAGKVSTYGELARYLNCRSARAIGQALRRNPFAPTVPCHRVVKSDRTLGGFSGHKTGPEIDRKRSLLTAEGVEFDSPDRVADVSLFRFQGTTEG